MILEVEEIHTYYGASHILFGISLQVAAGEVVALLGRNGAGKTTTLRSVMGLTPPKSGRVRFKGQEIAGMPAYEIAQLGLGFVPEDRRIFPDLTVRDNLEVAERPGRDGGRQWTAERVFSLFPKLHELADRKGRFLSGGEQQMLTIARTLMGNPELLLLDEPSEGLAPLIVRMLADLIFELKTSGMTILLAEQNVKFVRKLADRAYVIDNGRIPYQGAIRDLWENEEIKRRYLAV